MNCKDKNSGIYQIINTKNGKMYIGSAADLDNRRWHHKHYLSKNEHSNDHLQNAWNKYGEGVFKFEVVEFCDGDELRKKEKNYLEAFDTANLWDRLYNISRDTECAFRGETHSEESRELIVEANRGENNHGTSLTEKDVVEIRRRAKEGVSNLQLSEEYSIGKGGIGSVIRGRTWQHVGGPIRGEDYNVMLTDMEVRQIRYINAFENPHSSELAEEFDVSKALINKVISKEYYKDVSGPEPLGVCSITMGQAEKIYERRINGESLKDISKDYPICRESVRKVLDVLVEEYGYSKIDKDISKKSKRQKLSNFDKEDILEIRKRAKKENITISDLADDYDTPTSTVRGIVRGHSWKDVGGPIKGEDYSGENIQYLTEEQVVKIRKRYYSEKVSQRQLAKEFNSKQANISSIVLGKSWQHVGGPIKGEDY